MEVLIGPLRLRTLHDHTVVQLPPFGETGWEWDDHFGFLTGFVAVVEAIKLGFYVNSMGWS